MSHLILRHILGEPIIFIDGRYSSFKTILETTHDYIDFREASRSIRNKFIFSNDHLPSCSSEACALSASPKLVPIALFELLPFLTLLVCLFGGSDVV